jgi:transcriptional regulator NrdR family protein
MICINEHCDSTDIKVAETRHHEAHNWICRRRVCKECEYSWWTNEIPHFQLPPSLV